MLRTPRLWLLGLWALLAACGSVNGALREDGEEVATWEVACEDARSLVFTCGQDACAFYRCEEVAAPGRIVRTRGVAPVAPPPLRSPGPGAMRYRGSAQGLPRDARPVFIIPW